MHLSPVLRKGRPQNQLLFSASPFLGPASSVLRLRCRLRRLLLSPPLCFGIYALDARASAPGHIDAFPCFLTFFFIARFLPSLPPRPLQEAGMSHETTKHIPAIPVYMRAHHVRWPLPTRGLLRDRQHEHGIARQTIFSIPICGPQGIEIVVVFTRQVPPTHNTVRSCDRFLQHATLKAQTSRLKPMALLATEVLVEFLFLFLLLLSLAYSLLFVVFRAPSTTSLLVPVNAAHNFPQDGPKSLAGMPPAKSSPSTLAVLNRNLTPQVMLSAAHFTQEKRDQSFSHCCHTLLHIQRLHVRKHVRHLCTRSWDQPFRSFRVLLLKPVCLSQRTCPTQPNQGIFKHLPQSMS